MHNVRKTAAKADQEQSLAAHPREHQAIVDKPLKGGMGVRQRRQIAESFKSIADIYNYVDADEPRLAKMAGYRNLGYEVADSGELF